MKLMQFDYYQGLVYNANDSLYFDELVFALFLKW